MGARVARVVTATMVLGVVVGTCALGYGVSRLAPLPPSGVAVRAAAPELSARDAAAPAASEPFVLLPAPATLKLRPPLLRRGDHGPRVRELQARLRQLAWFFGDVDDDYGRSTVVAVKGFQDKRGLAVTGYVDRLTQQRLLAMTSQPTADELANRFPGDVHTQAALDARCRTGRALCVDKTSSTVRWVVDGHVLRTMAVRFGASYTPTREGLFHVGWKSRDHVSKLYGSAMPYSMFFSGGQAVHYSSDFAARGYAGASHGCVNVRDLAGIRWLFDQVRLGDKVVIYWS
jgi:hypothetical protein